MSPAAIALCTAVAHAGFSRNTVTAPNAAANTPKPSAAAAGGTTDGARRRLRHATTTSVAAAMSRSDASSRCVHSMRICGLSSGGNQYVRPSGCRHLGHASRHPIPDPEMRTTAPNTMCTAATSQVATAAARTDPGARPSSAAAGVDRSAAIRGPSR